MSGIKYQFAYDENQKIVSINDFTKDSCKSHTFKCIGCGRTLLPRALESICVRPHFYHKDIVCSSETYLHKLGKMTIKQKFDTSEEFRIKYKINKDCSLKECRLRNINCNKTNVDYEIDLKKYYNTCTLEAGVNGFIADLLLTNSSNSEIPPLLIEICVTHPCEEEKLNSGMKIIEITVSNEKDIISLSGSNVLEETPYKRRKNERSIKMIAFNRNKREQLNSDVYRYVYNPSFCDFGYYKTIRCDEAQYKIQADSALELNFVKRDKWGGFVSHNFKRISPLLWMAKNKGLRLCYLCKFYYATIHEILPICRLSKYGKPMFPQMREAEKCNRYETSNEKYDRPLIDSLHFEEVTLLPSMIKPTFRVVIAGSSSFGDINLFTQKCDYFLKSKISSHNVIVVSGTSRKTTELIYKYAENRNIGVEVHEANWGKYRQEAGLKSIQEMLEHADALIAFWDGKGKITKSLILKAKEKGIRIAIVKYGP